MPNALRGLQQSSIVRRHAGLGQAHTFLWREQRCIGPGNTRGSVDHKIQVNRQLAHWARWCASCCCGTRRVSGRGRWSAVVRRLLRDLVCVRASLQHAVTSTVWRECWTRCSTWQLMQGRAACPGHSFVRIRRQCFVACGHVSFENACRWMHCFLCGILSLAL